MNDKKFDFNEEEFDDLSFYEELDEQIMEERQAESEMLDKMTQEERIEYMKQKAKRVEKYSLDNNIPLYVVEGIANKKENK